MKHDLIKVPERHGGFTDLFTIDYTDMGVAAAQTDNDNRDVVLDALAAGDWVLDGLLEILTPWNSLTTAPIDTFTASVGPVGTETATIASAYLKTTGTPPTGMVIAKTTYAFTARYLPVAAINLVCRFDPDSSAKPGESTAGKLAIWLQISRWADRVGNRQIG